MTNLEFYKKEIQDKPMNEEIKEKYFNLDAEIEIND